MIFNRRIQSTLTGKFVGNASNRRIQSTWTGKFVGNASNRRIQSTLTGKFVGNASNRRIQSISPDNTLLGRWHEASQFIKSAHFSPEKWRSLFCFFSFFCSKRGPKRSKKRSKKGSRPRPWPPLSRQTWGVFFKNFKNRGHFFWKYARGIWRCNTSICRVYIFRKNSDGQDRTIEKVHGSEWALRAIRYLQSSWKKFDY